jgi:transposase
VKQERITWLALSKRFTARYENLIGRLCRSMSIKEVAELHHLTWDQVKRMDMAYMQRLVAQHPPSVNLRAIGVDEVSLRKGHSYAIVVADLDAKRPIWLGGNGRSENDMAQFFKSLGTNRCSTIELAVMDMWKPFRAATKTYAPDASIIFDKFHILRHLSDALDEVRRKECSRLSEQDRRFIKGQRYVLLSNQANLDVKGQTALALLLKANKRIATAYLLKESFAQLWDYANPTKCRKFFDNWKAQLRWQRLEPFEKFAAMIERHWDGIVSYCDPTHKVSLGFMEGLNTKIRVFQRRAYGIKDFEYLRLKVISSFIKDQLQEEHS